MKYPEGIAVDSQFNIYVGTDTSPDSSLMVFSPTANGPAPIRNLTNGLSAVDTEYVAVDLMGISSFQTMTPRAQRLRLRA